MKNPPPILFHQNWLLARPSDSLPPKRTRQIAKNIPTQTAHPPDKRVLVHCIKNIFIITGNFTTKHKKYVISSTTYKYIRTKCRYIRTISCIRFFCGDFKQTDKNDFVKKEGKCLSFRGEQKIIINFNCKQPKSKMINKVNLFNLMIFPSSSPDTYRTHNQNENCFYIANTNLFVHAFE